MSIRALAAALALAAGTGSLAASGAQGAPSSTHFSTNTLKPLQFARTEGYTPSQIQTAYGFTPLLNSGVDGTGQTIAFIELDGFSINDINAFDAKYGLPAPTILKTFEGGKKFKEPNQGEATMDLEWAHALAPGAKLHVYYMKNQVVSPSTWKAMGTLITTAVNDGATSISISLGTCGPSSGSSATRKALAQAEARGVTTFVSSGDTGAMPGSRKDCGRGYGAGYPASDPSVVSVGGTSLQLSSNNAIIDESAWNLSGGGQGIGILRPAWQVAPTVPAGQYREVPDVSFLADDSTGVSMYWKRHWIVSGGTSLGAPAWAAAWAVMAQNARNTGKTLPAGPATFYKLGASPAYTTALHDITSGSNGLYDATAGWDAVTGWGTPDVAQLANVITSIPAS